MRSLVQNISKGAPCFKEDIGPALSEGVGLTKQVGSSSTRTFREEKSREFRFCVDCRDLGVSRAELNYLEASIQL